MASRVVYAQLQTPEPSRAKAFYSELCGWTMHDDTPTDGSAYTEVFADGDQVAGIMSTAGRSPGWLVYLSVDNLDEAAAKAQALGATVTVPPTDIVVKRCRISVLVDPTGAVFALRGPLSSSGTP